MVMVTILLCSMKMYILLNNTVFIMAFFDGLNIIGIIKFRIRHPELQRPIKVKRTLYA